MTSSSGGTRGRLTKDDDQHFLDDIGASSGILRAVERLRNWLRLVMPDQGARAGGDWEVDYIEGRARSIYERNKAERDRLMEEARKKNQE